MYCRFLYGRFLCRHFSHTRFCQIMLAPLVAFLFCTQGMTPLQGEELPGEAKPKGVTLPGEEPSIFTRPAFSRKTRTQTTLSLSLQARPQTQGEAVITRNEGLRLGTHFYPGDSSYWGESWQITRLQWKPKLARVRWVKARTLAKMVHFHRHFSSLGTVVSLGLGLGVLDGLVRFETENDPFQERLDPFLPMTVGLAFRPWGRFQIGLDFFHAHVFRSHPVISHSLVMLTLGY